MTRQEILEGVRAAIADEVGARACGAVGFDSDLVSDLALDSLGLLTLTVALENRFEVCLEDPDESLTRVGVIVDRIAAALVDRDASSPGGATPPGDASLPPPARDHREPSPSDAR